MSNARSIRLGVIVERRKIDHPWQDHVWVPVEVVPGEPDIGKAGGERWRLLEEGPGWSRYYAATLSLELFPKETEAYQINLTSARPVIYVVLRRCEDGEGPEVEPFHVTASAEEVQEYLDAGEDIVEGVPMPPLLCAWIEAYVARYHQDVPFVKRVRKRWKESAGSNESVRRRFPEPPGGKS